MRVAIQKTWYSGGIPEYQAGQEYDVDAAVGSRLVRRGVAVEVTASMEHRGEPVIPLSEAPKLAAESTPVSEAIKAQATSVRKKAARKKRASK